MEGGPWSPQCPHRARPVHVAAVALFHGPQVRILLLQAVLQLLDTPGCWGNKGTPQLPTKLGALPPHPAAAPHSLPLSAGGSSSSMYSRFRCSSRSASCSFCLWTEEGQLRADRWAPSLPPSAGHSPPSWPTYTCPAAEICGPDLQDRSGIPWSHRLLSHWGHNLPLSSSADPWTSPLCPLLSMPQPTHWYGHLPPLPASSTLNLSSFLHPAARDLSSMRISSNKKHKVKPYNFRHLRQNPKDLRTLLGGEIIIMHWVWSTV